MQLVPIEIHTRSLLAAEGEKRLARFDPPTMLLVGLAGPLYLPVRLWASDCFHRMHHVVLAETSREGVIRRMSFILMGAATQMRDRWQLQAWELSGVCSRTAV